MRYHRGPKDRRTLGCWSFVAGEHALRRSRRGVADGMGEGRVQEKRTVGPAFPHAVRTPATARKRRLTWRGDLRSRSSDRIAEPLHCRSRPSLCPDSVVRGGHGGSRASQNPWDPYPSIYFWNFEISDYKCRTSEPRSGGARQIDPPDPKSRRNSVPIFFYKSRFLVGMGILMFRWSCIRPASRSPTFYNCSDSLLGVVLYKAHQRLTNPARISP